MFNQINAVIQSGIDRVVDFIIPLDNIQWIVLDEESE